MLNKKNDQNRLDCLQKIDTRILDYSIDTRILERKKKSKPNFFVLKEQRNIAQTYSQKSSLLLLPETIKLYKVAFSIRAVVLQRDVEKKVKYFSSFTFLL